MPFRPITRPTSTPTIRGFRPIVKPVANTQQPTPVTEEPNFFQRVGQSYQKAASNIGAGLQEGYNQAAKGGLGNALLGGKTVALRSAGAVAQAAFAPIVEAPVVKDVLEGVGEQIAKIPATQYIAQKVKEFSETNPELAKDLQNILDISMLAGGSAAEKPIQQSLANVSEKVAQSATNASTKVALNTSGVFKKAGEKLYDITIPASEKVLKAKQAYEATLPSFKERIAGLFNGEKVKLPTKKIITESETAARQGLVGTEWMVGVQAKKAANKLWSETILPLLKETKDKVDMRGFISNIEKEINGIADLSRRNTLLKGLESFKADYNKVGKVSLEKLQAYKEGWASFLPQKALKSGEEVAGAFKEIQNMASQNARQILYEKLGPSAKQAYIDYSNLQNIMKSGIKSVDPLRNKGITKQAWEFILDTAVTPVSTGLGQILYRTGQGLELIGEKGAKKVKDIIEGAAGKPSATLPKTSSKVSALKEVLKPKDRPGFARLPSAKNIVDEPTRDNIINQLNKLKPTDFKTIGTGKIKTSDIDMWAEVQRLKELFDAGEDTARNITGAREILARLGKLENPLDNVRIK